MYSRLDCRKRSLGIGSSHCACLQTEQMERLASRLWSPTRELSPSKAKHHEHQACSDDPVTDAEKYKVKRQSKSSAAAGPHQKRSGRRSKSRSRRMNTTSGFAGTCAHDPRASLAVSSVIHTVKLDDLRRVFLIMTSLLLFRGALKYQL